MTDIYQDAKMVDSAGNVVDPTPEPSTQKFPVLPKPIRAWAEHEVRFPGDKTNMSERVMFKLYNLWCIWSALHENTALAEKLMEKCDEDSDLYAMKHTIVDILDMLGKRLSDTDIVEEMRYLSEQKMI